MKRITWKKAVDLLARASMLRISDRYVDMKPVYVDTSVAGVAGFHMHNTHEVFCLVHEKYNPGVEITRHTLCFKMPEGSDVRVALFKAWDFGREIKKTDEYEDR